MKQIIFIRKLKDYFLSTGKLTKVIILLVLLLLPLLIYGNYQYRKTCRGLVDVAIRSKSFFNLNYKNVFDTCLKQAKTGDYRELYAYYKITNYVDRAFGDKGENNKYHWMLFYANENSKRYNNGIGLYEKELQNFEDMMTQEEKIKAFSYIADNIATGQEGWVKKHDYHKSFEYLKKAAKAGDVVSQGALGEAYFLGHDRYNRFSIEKDFVEAYKWLYISTKHSEQRIYDNNLLNEGLEIFTNNMTKEQINKAKQEANIWLKQNTNFIKSHSLKIIPMTKEEIEKVKKDAKEFIKDYKLDQPLPTSNQ